MLNQKILFKCLLLTFAVFLSCGSDDSYLEIPILTEEDIYQTCQNNVIELNVLLNDENIPKNGTFNINNLQNGTFEILNSNTLNDISDDVIKYVPDEDFTGSFVFTYTICNKSNCSSSSVSINVIPSSTVNFNLEEVPYQNLSNYNFFEGTLNDLVPAEGVLSYELNSPLFSDYAHKKRFVWMPCGVKANYDSDDSPLDFPIGAVLIKNFYYENVLPDNSTKIIETRLMYNTNDGWKFAKYVWNEEQTEATFTNNGSFVNLDWTENSVVKSVNYRIPSLNECFTCHNKFGTPVPIGPKPQNLNRNYDYVEGTQNQLGKWIEKGYLENNVPDEITSTIAWDDASQPLELRVRSYIDINCAHCHSDQSYCEYRPMRFAFNENDDHSNNGVCVSPDTQIEPFTKIIMPGNANSSLLVFRVSSVEEQYRMPLLGRTLKHEEGVRLIEDWINSLSDNCE